MNKKISCTITMGRSSERTSHALRGRHPQKQGNEPSATDIMELIPYRNYREQINDLMKPFIDEYNEKVEQRYADAWERYHSGQIKTKPRKRDYIPMGYDFYADHKNDMYFNRVKNETHTVKMWRGVILGLGDQSDRECGLITREEAVEVMTGVVRRWPEVFPAFKLLGATIHLNGKGFYHCHIDYFPLSQKMKEVKREQGLRVSHSQDAALAYMGFEPEQSIINATDKYPIRFNAFRNRLYYLVEAELNKHGIRLEYGVSKTKEPEKDSSTNQRLEMWQDIQDNIIQIQELKNRVLDVVQKDYVSPEAIKTAITTAQEMKKLLTTELQHKHYQTINDNVIVPVELFKQIQNIMQHEVDTVACLLNKIEGLTEQLTTTEDI